MSTLLKSRAGALVSRRALAQPMNPRFVGSIHHLTTKPSPHHPSSPQLSLCRSTPTGSTSIASPVDMQIFRRSMNGSSGPYIPRASREELKGQWEEEWEEENEEEETPKKKKPKGRWVFPLLLLTNIGMFYALYKSKQYVGFAYSFPSTDARLEQMYSDYGQSGTEMTPVRKTIVAKWDRIALESAQNLLGSCSTSLDQFLQGDYWSFVLAPISHVDLTHLGVNMMSMFFLSRMWHVVHPRFGFGKVALGAAAMGNFGQYAINYLHDKPDQRGLGASGMTSGIAAALLMTVPFRSMWDLALMVGVQWAYDGYRIANPTSGDRIGHGAHLGGAAYGVAYGLLMRRFLRR
ncbi:Integral membrane protease of the rhomboid family [Zalerion maritima]|uniref:Integral membrane protease of the rhomboid family n=1 Tax=Zalerion maritima TaxID=339359 RepID=A0AAD5RUS5_9PEZI|nr:Integral membrane protease of the rhomboid family [Zalerion maritima]